MDLVRSIEGVTAELVSRQGMPTGYPVSKIRIWAVEGVYLPVEYMFQDMLVLEVEVFPADSLEEMLTLDFKVVGPILNKEVQKIKGVTPEKIDGGWRVGEYELPEEAYKVRDKIPPKDTQLEKTTPDGRAKVEICMMEEPDAWEAVRFRKEVKRYITEDLGWDFTPEIFKAPRMYDEEGSTQDTIYVKVVFLDGPERVYQALEEYNVFRSYPISMVLPPRHVLHKLDVSPTVEINGCKLYIDRVLAPLP